MPPTVDYLPVATGVGANVDPQSTFAGSSYQINGFSTGLALPNQANKVWRQASMIAACIANFIANTLGINVLDDGNLVTLLANFIAALRGLVRGVNVVAFSATPVFDASLGDTQEITLTGNVTSSTLINLSKGQVVKFIIHQDGVGGHTFVWPASVAAFAGVIDPGVSNTSNQAFLVDNSTTPHPYTPMLVG